MVCPIRYQENEETQNKQALLVSCDLCSDQNHEHDNPLLSRKCRQRLFKNLPLIEKGTPIFFQLKKCSFLIPGKAVDLLKEYLDVLTRFNKDMNAIEKERSGISDLLFSDPLQAIISLDKFLKTKSSRLIHRLYSTLENTGLISKAKYLLSSADLATQSIGYDTLLESQIFIRNSFEIGTSQITDQIVDSYSVGPFKVQIFESKEGPFEKFYQVYADQEDSLTPQIIHFLKNRRIHTQDDDLRLLSLDEVIRREVLDFQNHLTSSFHELNEVSHTNLAILAMVQRLNLTKTLPLLLDDRVQEFYLDKPGDAFYLDHAQWGRCRTNLSPAQSELNQFISRLRLESRQPLDEKNPSLKTELRTRLFHVRAAVDIPPLAHDGLHLNIRKLRLRLITLPELVFSGTISLPAAAFLVLCLTLRINITIGGEPSSGKTTLANAINMLTPPNWRQIAIEDALEGIASRTLGKHNVTFKVDPFDSLENISYTKSNEIIRLLHRSPDWVFLGELQTAEHSAAMFHAISAGIKGIQTCHSASNDELLLRWLIHHKIPEICFQSLGLLVHMVREISSGQIIRRVAQISEIDLQTPKPSLRRLFDWNKASAQLEQLQKDPFTPLIKRTCKYQREDQASIQRRFNLYKGVLETLVNHQIFNPHSVIQTFDEAHARLVKRESSVQERSDELSQIGGEIVRPH